MDKKDIYEHLAKIYLDASSKKKKRNKSHHKLFKNLFILSIFMLAALSTALFSSSAKRHHLPAETALFLQNGPSKINFNFDPASRETYTINLNRLNVGRFKQLAFALRNMNPKDTIALRVEFTNAFKERSEVYIKDIPGKWRDVRINLAQFENINDWSEMNSLTFTVEAWNAARKKGVVYIDNIRLTK
ncbi:MAG: hypothetical protein WC937_02420 [Candidatus Omnitrophota bacterium]|jgi:hypothetical protein|nr:hypothetical protein [Candidatus Omnitrophota bacterium]